MAKEKFDYFRAFHDLTGKAIQEADHLIRIFENFDGADELYEDMQAVHEIEHAGDEINHAIFKNVARDFITPIDREDIISLSCNLDEILDLIEVSIQHIYMYDVHKVHEDAVTFAKLVKKSCVALHECTQSLLDRKNIRKEIAERIVKVNDAEEEADLLYMDVIRKLYTKEKDKPVKIMVWSRIFHNMEECCDACEHASDVLRTVLLKNS